MTDKLLPGYPPRLMTFSFAVPKQGLTPEAIMIRLAEESAGRIAVVSDFDGIIFDGTFYTLDSLCDESDHSVVSAVFVAQRRNQEYEDWLPE